MLHYQESLPSGSEFNNTYDDKPVPKIVPSAYTPKADQSLQAGDRLKRLVANKKAPRDLSISRGINLALTYSRICGHYHRPSELHGAVRNGKLCYP